VQSKQPVPSLTIKNVLVTNKGNIKKEHLSLMNTKSAPVTMRQPEREVNLIYFESDMFSSSVSESLGDGYTPAEFIEIRIAKRVSNRKISHKTPITWCNPSYGQKQMASYDILRGITMKKN